MVINVEIRKYLLNLKDNLWEYNQTHPLDEMAVSIENLSEWISDNGYHTEEYPITVIKNHADQIIVSQTLDNNKTIKFEMTYV